MDTLWLDFDTAPPPVARGRLRPCCAQCNRGLNTATGILCPTCQDDIAAALARMQDGEIL